MMTLIDDKLIDAMRDFVTASNRLQHLSSQGGNDLRLIESVSSQQRQAYSALQQALVERGWRRPGV